MRSITDGDSVKLSQFKPDKTPHWQEQAQIISNTHEKRQLAVCPAQNRTVKADRIKDIFPPKNDYG